VKREWFLTALLALYLVLFSLDHKLLARTPFLVDWKSLSLITALILTSKGLELSGVFSRLAPKLVELSHGSERRLVLYLVPIVVTSSAIIMNDTAMLVFVPLVIATADIARINVSRAVTVSAIAANVGSALTPIGNPQNIIIWNTYGLSFMEFVRAMCPYVSLWVFCLVLSAFLLKDDEMDVMKPPSVVLNGRLLFFSAFLLIANILLTESGHHWMTLPLTVIVLLVTGREALLGFDWALVLTFAFIFVDFGEVARLISGSSWLPSGGLVLLLASAGLSQLISNVPATVVFLGSKPEWLPLALGVNLGGTGIITGSLANLIALRISGIGIKDFHRFSIPYFLVALVISILVLLL